jgi:hypothetical protein
VDEVRWRFKRGGGVGGKGERRMVLGLGLRVGGGVQRKEALQRIWLWRWGKAGCKIF